MSFFAKLFRSRKIADDYQPAQVYLDLRAKAFAVTPGEINFDKAGLPAGVFGVLMETGYQNSAVTLVAFADGSANLYFSNGGGITGSGTHKSPQEGSRALVGSASQFLKYCESTSKFPLPRISHTRFYLLTSAGVFTLEAKEDDLGNNRHILSPLFHRAHKLITEVRKIGAKVPSEAP